MATKKRFFKKTQQSTKEKRETVSSKKIQKAVLNEPEKSYSAKILKQVQNDKRIKEKLHFPKISRVIPDGFGKLTTSPTSNLRLKWVVVAILVVVALAWNWFVLSSLLKVGKSWISLLERRQQLVSEMALWENISQKYPTYRDAYVEGAMYAYRLGNRGKEQYFLQQLQLLDPNFPLTKTLEQLLNPQTTAGN